MKIKVIIKEPGKAPVLTEIENELGAFQKVVGGYIETVTFAEDACIVCNEEGRLLGMPYNCNFCGIRLVGTIIVCGVSGDEFCDVPVDCENVESVFKRLFT